MAKEDMLILFALRQEIVFSRSVAVPAEAECTCRAPFPMDPVLLLWIIFAVTFVTITCADLFMVTHRSGEIGVGRALRWTALWVGIALGFCGLIGWLHPAGWSHAGAFVTGYLTEYSLSIDNLFVFILIFSLMRVPAEAQPKLIKLGILLSIVLRIGFIWLGVELVERFHFLLYLFGALLLWTAWKMFSSQGDESVHPEQNLLYQAAAKLLPLHSGDVGRRLFVQVAGKWHITPLFLVFLVIGSTDVLFAVDSIPAILGISTDRFVIITSNVFAVLGLNSLFFALRGVMGLFRYLKHGVSLILLFIGLKMILGAIPSVEHWFKGHGWVSLAVIASLLAGAILISVLHDRVQPESPTA